ncbi:putative gamma-glutamylcyclotransferase At3g02910 [Prosopis cineraria]|uniref:putative gamma-glutamylcyclotransferase At3g02910 n=1 Tax=Prosopis cineraria TaxID=364024 RepID=UPI00240FB670|nr:putative gamma-glutamylcyclotransferase At3g02910 [Prosopis cineraria]
MVAGADDKRTLIFTYGTLKRGFSNHVLLQDLIRSGDAAFVGVFRTSQKYPLVCGPYRVPFLLNFIGSGYHVRGELYSVTARGLARMDELEGTTRGHYERLPISVFSDPAENDGDGEVEFGSIVNGGIRGRDGSSALTYAAEAYFAHRSYAVELWKKNEKRGFECYTEKEARGYVKRKDRPQNLTFLDHIRLFVTSD